MSMKMRGKAALNLVRFRKEGDLPLHPQSHSPPVGTNWFRISLSEFYPQGFSAAFLPCGNPWGP